MERWYLIARERDLPCRLESEVQKGPEMVVTVSQFFRTYNKWWTSKNQRCAANVYLCFPQSQVPLPILHASNGL